MEKDLLGILEDDLGITYPKCFRKIDHTGAMEWLKHDYTWIEKNREALESNPKAFLYGMSDCELTPFRMIHEDMAYLEEMYNYDELYVSGEIQLNSKYKIIPFGKEGGGDVYCFLYQENNIEPIVTIYGHDTGEMAIYTKDFETFLFLQMALAVVEKGYELEKDCIKEHIKFLLPEHQRIFKEKDVNTLKKKVEQINEQVLHPAVVDIFI